MTRVSVLGAGSWGTAFSLVLADAGNDVTLWARREEVCETINRRRENTDYLPGVELPAKVYRHPRHRARARRRRRRRVRGAVADVPGQPRAVGAPRAVLGGHGVADEGRRARHA